jgi:uncharacterized protein (TIGR00730 family)
MLPRQTQITRGRGAARCGDRVPTRAGYRDRLDRGGRSGITTVYAVAMEELRRIAVYCGARDGGDQRFRHAATTMGRELAARGIGLVYGGGGVGMMGALADSVLAEGGHVIGVIPSFMDGRESIHDGLSELRISRSMHDRKATMLDLSDAAIALPGGLGTLDEFIEALTWSQLGLHRIPCGLLDVDGYWGPLVGLIAHATRYGFVDPGVGRGVICSDRPDELLDRLCANGRAPRSAA